MSFLVVDFGTTKAGLSTVGYELRNNLGAISVARTITGVADMGNGFYGVEVELAAADIAVKWDTGEITPVFAHEDLADYRNEIFLKNRNEMNQGGTPRQTIYQDDGTTVYMEGDAFEDQTGSTPYNGSGIERRDGFS